MSRGGWLPPVVAHACRRVQLQIYMETIGCLAASAPTVALTGVMPFVALQAGVLCDVSKILADVNVRGDRLSADTFCLLRNVVRRN